jgi:MFS family permease
MTLVYAVFILLLVTFGAVVMSLEILSSNLMSPYFGGSIYIWGSIISSFMVHFSVGYVVGGWLARRFPRIRSWRPSRPLLIWCLIRPSTAVCEWFRASPTSVSAR